MAHERQCKICGSTYKYCPRCAQYASLPRWKSLFCTEDCKTIYDVVDQFVSNQIEKSEAKIALESFNVNISNEEIKGIINDIMIVNEEPKKKKEKKQKVEEDIIIEEPIVENIEIVNVD